MPGIHTFLSPPEHSSIRINHFATEDEDPNHKTNVLIQDAAAILYVTYYDGYPFSLWQSDDEIILLEGMIYNQSKDKIEAQLRAITQCFHDNGDYHQLVRAFVESADGEFIVEIWDSQKKRLLLFNDYWGRLPLYYYCLDELCGISREIKNLLSFAPEIRLDQTSIVEFLYFEFPLGNKTLIENIYRLGPACMLTVQSSEKGPELKISQVVDINFDLKEPFASESESIEVLKELFLQSVQSRVQTLEDGGFRIVADLSGGFDSRAVLGGLEKFTQDAIYCTQTLNTNDQRKLGQAVFEAMDSPGRFYTAAPNHAYEVDRLGAFVFRYDCMANFSVGFNSSQVVCTLRDLVPEKAARFMGFGGEFLRHPIKAFRKSLIYGIDKGFYFYSNTMLSDVCQFAGMSYRQYHQELEAYLETYPEQTPEGQLRRLYFEYFNRYVNASEDYCRKYFWIVSPFWGSFLMRAIMERIPLDWTGFKYFTHFMKALDPRLLQTSIFGKSVRLDSRRSLHLFETKERLRTWITAFIPFIHYGYKTIQSKMKDHKSWKKIEPVIRDTTCPLIQLTLPQGQLKMKPGNVLISRRYLTLQLYLSEIEKRYRSKVFR
jgi:glutamine amidotransferase-like protein